MSANPTSLKAQCLGKNCFHIKRAENIDRNGCDAAKLSYLLLNRAYLPQFCLWNIHFHSDKLHFNDSSNSNDPVYDLWLKSYVLVLCHATHTTHLRLLLLLLLSLLLPIYTTYALCVCRQTTLHSLAFQFFFVFIYFLLLLFLSLDSALYSTLYTIIIKCDRVHPTKVFLVCCSTNSEIITHTRDIMMVNENTSYTAWKN